MPPSSSQESEQSPRRYCAMAPHILKQPSRKINDLHLFRFAKRINSEMRLGAPMCMTCYQQLMNIYRLKMANAKAHKERREAAAANSVSDVSSSQRMELSSDPSTVTVIPSQGGVTMRRKLPARSPNRSPAPTRSSTSATDVTPSTSTSATAAKRKRTSGEAQPPPAPAAVSSTSYVSDDDDANSNLSLNAVNGTRLPHIQPIPKRRQFVHLNKQAMDIYLAGTTGG